MIARTHRFHGFNSLRHVYSRGQTARSALITTKYLLNPRRSSYRAAVVVSRKTHKSAVVRNRIRRRIYEIIRTHESAMTGAYDMVITVFSDQVATMDVSALEKMILDQLLKAHVVTPVGSKGPRGGHDIVKAIEEAVDSEESQ